MIKHRAAGPLPFEVNRRTDLDDFFDRLIAPYRPAPVLIQEAEGLVLKTMSFSLIPRWSKEPRVRFATHNARIETIAEKPTWREAFRLRHCVVPLTDFIEPIYTGEHAGYMVAFHQAEGRWLYAAGIWEEWANKETGEIIESFSVVTGEPPEFIAEVGHDRCPIFLDETHLKIWLRAEDHTAPEWLKFLKSSQSQSDFAVERYRAMKSGWERRIPAQEG